MTLQLFENTKVTMNLKMILIGVPLVVGALFWLFRVEAGVTSNKGLLKEVKATNATQNTQIQLSREMVAELKAQTRLVLKAVEKLDERVYKNSSKINK